MKSSSIETIVSMFESIDACRWNDLAKYFHDDIRYIRPGYPPIEGLADLIDFYRNRRIIKSGHHELELLCVGESGQALSAIGSFAGFDRCGNALSVRFCDVYRLDGEKVKSRETFFDSPAV